MAYPEDTLDSMQRMLDFIYRDDKVVDRSVVMQAVVMMSLPEDVERLFDLLPPGRYSRRLLVDQLNSAIVGHGMGRTLGTVE